MARVGAALPVKNTLGSEHGEYVQSLIDAGEEVVTLHGATLKTWNVMANGMGFDLHFTVPLGEVAKLTDMTAFLQRLVEVQVTRYSRGLRVDQNADDGVNWAGIEDGE